ncbi:hypothetical protein PROFUN_15421 [Planoprotostelium fungivorum]|uniref:Uncharacterized protein n=1 Tax=Planoprotostelium fungivorum TaxID=1890364 RepID=A0A2P6MWQ1_9EUKA|nr:hypothetical protein PROFUN_15421 [Planoprotostelium fungivorum]
MNQLEDQATRSVLELENETEDRCRCIILSCYLEKGAVDDTDPRTIIESECERETNVSKLLLPVDALVQNEVYKTAKDLKGINSC